MCILMRGVCGANTADDCRVENVYNKCETNRRLTLVIESHNGVDNNTNPVLVSDEVSEDSNLRIEERINVLSTLLGPSPPGCCESRTA